LNYFLSHIDAILYRPELDYFGELFGAFREEPAP